MAPIPPKVRAIIYAIYTALALVVGGVAIWFQVTADTAPSWLDIAGKVLLYLGNVFGLTAATATRATVDPTAFPPKVRRISYWVWFIATAVVSAISIVFLASAGVEPPWVTGANAILVFLGGALGLTAASHVVTSSDAAKDPAQPEAMPQA